MKKRVLFFFVHPAKFHLSRATVNALKNDGHHVDVIITGRDILEELVINEGWEYKKIFSNGRKISWLHVWISASIFILLTVLKLLQLTWRKKYDLFITDDCLTFVGRIKRTPSVFVTDDDLSAVPESSILMASANYILAPDICELGKYNPKKWGYYGYKSIFHLHPNRFTPDVNKIHDNLVNKDYFFIRTVSATSTHDVGKRGIGDDLLRNIINVLKEHGDIVLNSERELPEDLQKYVLDFHKNDVAHYVANAKIFISDSTTMCAEAAVLAVPAIEIDDWFADFKQYNELNSKYKLLFGFGVDDFAPIQSKIEEFLKDKDLKKTFKNRQQFMLTEKIDASAFLIWMIKKYPNSSKEFFKDTTMQLKFK
ncbi:hypothetical protein [uncultured Polaribacter sp.]|uniref:hypothetical protein n=1 Tax=uncultured Polaribacter sp. TaxID=174711 RepID=UPI00259B5127|nr:hypothetical protein [uncultured Polaribacter sp.]